MIFSEMNIKGVYIIEPEPLTDERGFFARSFCTTEFKDNGLDHTLVQCNISFNRKKGTLRGMHYQSAPFEEAKIVSCPKGVIYDVVLDLRKDSKTYCQWIVSDLSDKNFKMMYIPKGCAHGFQTLEDDTTVYYQMTEVYHPECARGVRWDDPAFGIVWPFSAGAIISKKDKNYSFLRN
jgi:dTDP-4-dehydrorhamnose 3,5-epimerase